MFIQNSSAQGIVISQIEHREKKWEPVFAMSDARTDYSGMFTAP
jgi:hypothetical protein